MDTPSIRRDAGERAAFLAGLWTYAAHRCPERLHEIVLEPVSDAYPVQQPKIFPQFPPALAIAGGYAVVFHHQERQHDECVPVDEVLKYVDPNHRNHIGYTCEADINNIRLQILDVSHALRGSHALYSALKSLLLEGIELDAQKVANAAEIVAQHEMEEMDEYFKPAHDWMQERRRLYAGVMNGDAASGVCSN